MANDHVNKTLAVFAVNKNFDFYGSNAKKNHYFKIFNQKWKTSLLKLMLSKQEDPASHRFLTKTRIKHTNCHTGNQNQ